jgi:hypothetical protein
MTGALFRMLHVMRRLVLVLVLGGVTVAGVSGGALAGTPPKKLGQVLASTRRRPEFDETRAQLDKLAAAATRGYQRDGDAQKVALEDAAWRVPVKRGRCYRAVVRLGTGAVFSDLAERGLRFDVKLPGAAAKPSGGAHGPGGIFDLHCADVDGMAEVRAIAIAGEALPAKVRVVGVGPVQLQMFWKEDGGGD